MNVVVYVVYKLLISGVRSNPITFEISTEFLNSHILSVSDVVLSFPFTNTNAGCRSVAGDGGASYQ